MSKILMRAASTRKLPSVAQEQQHYQLLTVDSDSLTKEIASLFRTTEALVNYIDSQLAAGILPEAHFIELMANTLYEKDIKRFKDKINSLYTKIVNIYVDTLISLNKDAINSISLSELCSPASSTSLKQRCYDHSANLTSYIIKSILGFETTEKYESRDKSIPDKERMIRRTLRFQLWIEIATQLMNKNDEMGCLIVIFALEDRSISRLKKLKEGLADQAKQSLERLILFKEYLTGSEGGANYYSDSVKRTPIVPAAYYMLRPIIQVAVNEKESTNDKSLWQKLKQYQVMDDVMLLLLKEQHPIFATVLPIWEFVVSKVNNIQNFYTISGLKDRAVVNQLNHDTAYAISLLIEAFGSSQLRLSDEKITPVAMVDYIPKHEQPPASQPDNLRDFRVWIQTNYFKKLIKLSENIPLLLTFNDALKREPKNYSLDDLQKLFEINETLIGTISVNKHAVNVLLCLGNMFGFDELGIDKARVEVVQAVMQMLEPSLDACRTLYFEIHQRNLIEQEDNLELAALKLDIFELHDSCVCLLDKIGNYLTNGSLFQLKDIKVTLNLLRLNYIKYSDLVEKANKDEAIVGKKLLKLINDNHSEITRQFQSTERLLAEDELLSVNPLGMSKIITNLKSRLEEQTTIVTTSAFKDSNLKKYRDELIKVISALEDLLLEIPIFLDRQYFKGKENSLEQLVNIRGQAIQLKHTCQNSINEITVKLQQNKLKSLEPIEQTAAKQQELRSLLARCSIAGNKSLFIKRSKSDQGFRAMVHTRLNIPSHFKIGKYLKSCGNFYDSLSLALNSIYREPLFDEKTLRLICFDLYLNQRARLLSWQSSDAKTDIEKDPYYKIKYTEGEMNKLFNKEAIRGEHHKEGRALCIALKLKAIWIIELKKKPRNDALIARYILITENDCIVQKKIDYMQCIAESIPILLLNHDGHYMPLQQLSGISQSLQPLSPPPAEAPDQKGATPQLSDDDTLNRLAPPSETASVQPGEQLILAPNPAPTPGMPRP